MQAGVAVVVNVRFDQYDVAVDRTSIFGNPFPEWKWGRAECIRKYERYFYDWIERDPEWKAEVLKLATRGRPGEPVRLGCHCVPLECHGQIIADYLNAHEWLEPILDIR